MSPGEKRLRRRLAANVRALREARSWTLEVAAERIQMHARHLQKIEAGEVNVTLHTLARLQQALDVDVAELLA